MAGPWHDKSFDPVTWSAPEPVGVPQPEDPGSWSGIIWVFAWTWLVVIVMVGLLWGWW